MSGEPHPLWKDTYKEGVVYLHAFPRAGARCVPNISPFAIKLELWLKMNDIPHEVIDTQSFSRKGQIPYILFNGQEIPDSNFIVEFLCNKFDKDPYPGLSKPEKATARAFSKMLEDNTTWPIFVYRYVEHKEEYSEYFFTHIPTDVKAGIQDGLQESVKKRAEAHGIGRHSSEEIQKMGCDDVQAISDFLADKPYMMGDIPTLVDCSVFGVLSQVVYVPMGFPMRKYILDKCPNIIRYCDRITSTYWKNWQEHCDA